MRELSRTDVQNVSGGEFNPLSLLVIPFIPFFIGSLAGYTGGAQSPFQAYMEGLYILFGR